MRIVVILASGDEQPREAGKPTILMETFLQAYYTLRDANVEVVLASSTGGYPMNLARGDWKKSSPVVRRFMKDRVARDELADTLSLDQVYADDFEAAFCVGEPIWPDGPEAALIGTLLSLGKPVAVIADGGGSAPCQAGKGLLIIGGSARSAIRALLSAAQP